MCSAWAVVLCSFFPRADCGRGGLHMALRRSVILLNHFSPVLRHFSKSCGGSARPFPWLESPYACARSFLMAFSCLLLYHALRSSRVGVCERDVFGHGGVQFQANVLPRVSDGSISRGSVRRGPNTAHTVRWRCGEIGQTCERGGESGAGEAVEGEFRRRKAEQCAQVRNFCRKAPRFSSFYGDFCAKVSTFFFVLRFFAR